MLPLLLLFTFIELFIPFPLDVGFPPKFFDALSVWLRLFGDKEKEEEKEQN